MLPRLGKFKFCILQVWGTFVKLTRLIWASNEKKANPKFGNLIPFCICPVQSGNPLQMLHFEEQSAHEVLCFQ